MIIHDCVKKWFNILSHSQKPISVAKYDDTKKGIEPIPKNVLLFLV